MNNTLLYFMDKVGTKKTLVIGASQKPERYSNKAVRKLAYHQHPIYAFGIRAGQIGDIAISTTWPDPDEDIHTITMYIRAIHQETLYDDIFSLNPKRIIFNPGTENTDLYKLAKEKGIEVLNACTLVMLSIGDY